MLEGLFKLSVIYSAVDKMTGPVKGMASTVMGFEKSMQQATGMVHYGQRLGLTAAVVSESAQKMKSVMMGFVEPFAAVQQPLAKLQTATTSTMGSMDQSMKMTMNSAKSWSKQHVDTVESYLTASYAMASAGLTDMEVIKGTEAALSLATATMGDAGSAAEIVARLYGQLGDKTKDVGSEMTHIADILTKTQQMFQIRDLHQLTEGMKYAVPSMVAYKMSLEDVNSVLGALNNAGLTDTLAGTAFVATMEHMTKASRELGFAVAHEADGGLSLVGTLANIEAKFGSFNQWTDQTRENFRKLFGDQGIRVLELTVGKTAQLSENMKKLKDSTGATAEAQKIMEGTFNAALQRMENKMNAIKMSLGEKLLGSKKIIDEVIPKYTQLIEQVGEATIAFADANPEFAKWVLLAFTGGTAFLLLLAPVLSIIAGVITLGGTILQFIIKVGQGFLWLSAAISSGRAAASLGVLCSWLGRAAVFGWNLIQIFASIALMLYKFAELAVVAAVRGLGTLAVALWQFTIRAIMAAATALPPLIAAVWSFTVALLANPLTWVIMAIVGVCAAIVVCIKYWDDITVAATSAWDWIVSVFDGGLNAVQTSINDALGWVQNLFSVFFNSGAALWDAFTGGIRSALYGPVEAVQEGLQWVRNLLPFSDAKEGPLSQLSKSGRALMSTLAEGVKFEAPALFSSVEDGLDIRSLFNRDADQGSLAGAGGGQYHFYGDILIDAKDVEKPEDFFAIMKRFAQEVGG
ncbi:MAG: phage tail tape measure protein [Negativicutes bacterium]|nr:phage tail tape measure protein [Negativicutes bacterium]